MHNTQSLYFTVLATVLATGAWVTVNASRPLFCTLPDGASLSSGPDRRLVPAGRVIYKLLNEQQHANLSVVVQCMSFSAHSHARLTQPWMTHFDHHLLSCKSANCRHIHC